MSLMFRLLVLTFLLVAIATGGEARLVRAQPPNPLVGTWALVSTIETLSDGMTRADLQVGPMPKGYMIYGDANRMCGGSSPMIPLDRTGHQRRSQLDQELRSIIDFMGVYCSRYEVNVAEGYVLHHVRIQILHFLIQ